jgi:hypothetical protein
LVLFKVLTRIASPQQNMISEYGMLLMRLEEWFQRFYDAEEKNIGYAISSFL